MAFARPIIREQGNQQFRTADPRSAAKRGQTVPYDINGAPSGGSNAAIDTSFTPAGSISSSNVQAAIEELDATVSGISSAGYTVVTKIAGYTETATSGELIILADLAAGFTITLPTAVGNTAKITVKKMQAAGSIIVDGSGAQTIDGGATATLTLQYEYITIVSDGSNWQIIGG